MPTKREVLAAPGRDDLPPAFAVVMPDYEEQWSCPTTKSGGGGCGRSGRGWSGRRAPCRFRRERDR
jgi:hypothetical protein